MSTTMTTTQPRPELAVTLACPQGADCDVRVRLADGIPYVPFVCSGAHVLSLAENLALGKQAIEAEQRAREAE